MWPRCSTYFQRKSSDLLIRVKGAKRPPQVPSSPQQFKVPPCLCLDCWHPFEKRGWPSVKKSRDSTWKWMSFKCRVFFSPQNSNRFWSWKTTQREVLEQDWNLHLVQYWAGDYLDPFSVHCVRILKGQQADQIEIRWLFWKLENHIIRIDSLYWNGRWSTGQKIFTPNWCGNGLNVVHPFREQQVDNNPSCVAWLVLHGA